MEEQNSQLSSTKRQNKELISECEMFKEELNIKSQMETFDILTLSLPYYQSNFIEQIEPESKHGSKNLFLWQSVLKMKLKWDN